MADMRPGRLSNLVRKAAHPLAGAARDYDPLIKLVGDARFVLLGEASHGTHEFYRERAQITKRLIEEKGFTAVAARSRLARRLSNQSLRCRAAPQMPTAWKLFRTSSDFRRGCGATPTCWTKSAGFAITTTTSRRAARRSVFTDSISTAFIPQSKLFSIISTKLIRKARSARAIAIRASSISAKTRKPMATRLASD